MKVYLDNAATTPIAKEVAEVMCACIQSTFGNPSSIHGFGREAKSLIEISRRTIAQKLHCKPSEIIFTSGGTEADNMALFAAYSDLGVERIVTSQIEHHAVLHTSEYMAAKLPVAIEFVNVDSNGNVDLEDLEKNLQSSSKKTIVSLMHANNEIGTKIDLYKLSKICRENKAFLHSDTVQTMGHYTFDLSTLDIDFITCAAHKFHGPKGVGFLYLNKNLNIQPIIHGGSQERGLRGGTENIYGIVGMAKAMELANDAIEEHIEHVQGLKSFMVEELQKRIPGVKFHGELDPTRSLYTVLNVCFPKITHPELLLLTLDLKGVACSGGSACSSGSDAGSHVLFGIKAPTDTPNARFSFSRYTTKEEVEFALDQIEEVVLKQLA